MLGNKVRVQRDSLLVAVYAIDVILRICGERNAVEGSITAGTREALHVVDATVCSQQTIGDLLPALRTFLQRTLKEV